MNVAQAAQLVRKYADEATGRLKPDEDGYMGADGRQLFETQPLDEFIVDIRKELLDVINYAAFGLHRLDEILAKIESLNDAATEYRHTVPDLLAAIGLDDHTQPLSETEVEAAVYSPSREVNRIFGEGLESGLRAAQPSNLYAELHLQDPSLREAVLDIAEGDMEPLR